MSALAEAWEWYRGAHQQLKLFQRLVRRYWTQLPWAGVLDRDDEFKTVDPARVITDADEGLGYLDDLAVVVLFSAFEDVVRTAALGVFDQHAVAVTHPVVQAVFGDSRDQIEQGSFFRVLQAYKPSIDVDLIEQVNQVRKYRNWVAHGRRGGETPANVTPLAAYDRLRAFLAALGLT